MFQFTTILLPSIDDIINFFTELRTNPVDTIILIFTKVFELAVRIIKPFLKIFLTLGKVAIFTVPKDMYGFYLKVLDYGLQVTPNVLHCYNKKRKFLVFLEA